MYQISRDVNSSDGPLSCLAGAKHLHKQRRLCVCICNHYHWCLRQFGNLPSTAALITTAPLISTGSTINLRSSGADTPHSRHSRHNHPSCRSSCTGLVPQHTTQSRPTARGHSWLRARYLSCVRCGSANRTAACDAHYRCIPPCPLQRLGSAATLRSRGAPHRTAQWCAAALPTGRATTVRAARRRS